MKALNDTSFTMPDSVTVDKRNSVQMQTSSGSMEAQQAYSKVPTFQNQPSDFGSVPTVTGISFKSMMKRAAHEKQKRGSDSTSPNQLERNVVSSQVAPADFEINNMFYRIAAQEQKIIEETNKIKNSIPGNNS